MECEDANGVEVYAMLVGCRELRKFDVTNEIIQGDYFLAIQWGLGYLGKAYYP